MKTISIPTIKLLFILLIGALSLTVHAQQPSAILDLESTTQGVLVPRMTSSERMAIVSPAQGLLVYDTDIKKFYYHDHVMWNELGAGSAPAWDNNANGIHRLTDSVGIGTAVPQEKLHINDGNLLVGDSIAGAGGKLFYNADKYAFRGGFLDTHSVIAVYWDLDSLGTSSFAYGRSVKASGNDGATALGYGAVASGGFGAIAMGLSTTASGHQGATALGRSTTAAGDLGATALGYFTNALGNSGATALGNSTMASGDNGATALGYSSKAQGEYGATALGRSSIASGDEGATAAGYFASASGDEGAIALGHFATATGNQGAVSLGYYTTASGSYGATALGMTTRASDSSSISIGAGTLTGQYLDNNIPRSLMIGFNSNIPTMFVGPSDGVNTTGNVGIGTTIPQGKLDITSTSQGFLLPRMATSQRMAISSPAQSTLVYDITTKSFYYFENGIWNELGAQELQVLSVSNDTIFLSNGGFAKLPANLDNDPVNEIQTMSVSETGDTMYISDGNYIIVPGISAANGPKDGDGYIYQTAQIAGLEWFAENLRTTSYNDGTPLPHVLDNSIWQSFNQPGYCYYNNDSIINRQEYGALYNSFAIRTTNPKNVCPVNWHVATAENWDSLIVHLGGSTVAGGKLKEVGFEHWDSPNTGATDEFDFTARGGGGRLGGGNYFSIKQNGSFWGIRRPTDTSERSFQLGRAHDDVIESATLGSENFGYSVRCVRDE